MKSIILLTFILIVVSSTEVAEIQPRAYQNDSCFQENIKDVLQNIKNLAILNENSGYSMDLFGDLLKQFTILQKKYEECNVSLTQAINGDMIKLYGEALLLGAACGKDCGAIFLIADTIVMDPFDITNDIFALVFLTILGKSTAQDCNAFYQFITHIL